MTRDLDRPLGGESNLFTDLNLGEGDPIDVLDHKINKQIKLNIHEYKNNQVLLYDREDYLQSLAVIGFVSLALLI